MAYKSLKIIAIAIIMVLAGTVVAYWTSIDGFPSDSNGGGSNNGSGGGSGGNGSGSNTSGHYVTKYQYKVGIYIHWEGTLDSNTGYLPKPGMVFDLSNTTWMAYSYVEWIASLFQTTPTGKVITDDDTTTPVIRLNIEIIDMTAGKSYPKVWTGDFDDTTSYHWSFNIGYLNYGPSNSTHYRIVATMDMVWGNPYDNEVGYWVGIYDIYAP